MRSLVRVLVAGVLAVAVVTPAGVAHAREVPSVPGPVTLVTSWKVIVLSTSSPVADFTRPVARCTASAGSTCTITQAAAVSTTVQVSLGYSNYGVASSLGFSLSRTSTTSVSCSSPRLGAGQSYVGYAQGTQKRYWIQEWQTNSSISAPPPHLVATSSLLTAFQPFAYPSIYCRVQ